MTSEAYKIVIVGAGGVGKSSLTLRLVQNSFQDRYDPTIEDSYRKTINVDGKSVDLDIYDTAGQEEYETLQDGYMRRGDGFIIVYNIADDNSFKPDVLRFFDKIQRVKERDSFPMVLVGNKSDLAHCRQVTTQEGIDLAARYNCRYIEASAKANTNVVECFHQCVREINKEKKAKAPKKNWTSIGKPKRPKMPKKLSRKRCNIL